ncbi:MAG: folate family ECF transporter S component [Synergistetes bacterium]|nr:folate family ECF transporter S component [Synergistota bacterium]MCX8127851.1 folate family ECF transporter S component [Synergistota bacterium]MDW8192113.1 folate family ECF transporter S component [Synergistota bacterium]
MRFSTSTMVHASILIAISIVLTRFASFMLTPYIRLGFGPVPIYIGGILFGPWVGAIIGALADIVGFWFNTFGAAFPNPFITLASLCRGLLPPLFLKALGAKQLTFRSLIISIILTEIVAGLGLTTYGLTLIYKVPFSVLIVPRLISTSLLVIIYSLLIYAIATKLLATKVFHKEFSTTK